MFWWISVILLCWVAAGFGVAVFLRAVTRLPGGQDEKDPAKPHAYRASEPYKAHWHDLAITWQQRAEGNAEMLKVAEAELERLRRWKHLMEHAPAGVKASIQQRFLQSEAIGPIVAAWKQKVANLEAENAKLRQQRDATRPYLEHYLQSLMIDQVMSDATDAERRQFLEEEKQAVRALFQSLEH